MSDLILFMSLICSGPDDNKCIDYFVNCAVQKDGSIDDKNTKQCIENYNKGNDND